MISGRPVKIKLCEFETLDVSWEASYLGPDMMGFHIFRHQDVEERVERFDRIFVHLNPTVERVILSDLQDDVLVDVIRALQPDALQYYPQTSPDHFRRLIDPRLFFRGYGSL